MPEKEQLAENVNETRAAELTAREVLLHSQRAEFEQEKKVQLKRIKDAEDRIAKKEATAPVVEKSLPYCPIRDGHLLPFYIPEDYHDPFTGRNRRIQKLLWVNDDHYMRKTYLTVDQFTTKVYWNPLKPGDTVLPGDVIMRANSIERETPSDLTEEAPRSATIQKVKINEYGIVELEA